MKRVLFISGTRADYGKIKPLIQKLCLDPDFSVEIYATGMHLSKAFGSTYIEIQRDFPNALFLGTYPNDAVFSMSRALGHLILELTEFVKTHCPDLIVVHGDRIDSFGAAIVGALNNIRVAHIEGGEVSGTIDESIRHSTSKMAHLHFVANEEAKNRILQLGEDEKSVFIIGSPDIDVMLGDLPTIDEVKKHYQIPFENYGILMYHPVTTELQHLAEHAKALCEAVLASQKNYVVIYPNNDLGSDTILDAYQNILKGNDHFRFFPSIRFEYFLTLLKNCDFILGNSSAGIREAGVYGVPSLNVGSRQSGRYSLKDPGIVSVLENKEAILSAIIAVRGKTKKTFAFGHGDSAELFYRILKTKQIWEMPLQKRFNDLETI